MLEEVDVLIEVFEDEDVDQNFKFLRQLLDELLFVIVVVSELVPDALLHLLIYA